MTQARLSYYLPQQTRVRLTVCDLAGRVVAKLAEGIQQPGLRNAVWDGRDMTGTGVPSGIYFCRLEAQGQALVGRFVLLH